MEGVLMGCKVQAYMKLKTPEAREKAWQMIKLMEIVSLSVATVTDKMVVSLLKIDMLSASETIDSNEFYNGEYATLSLN
jgi:hypothetical protein